MEMLLEQVLVPVEEEKIQEVSEGEGRKEAETKGAVRCLSPFSREEELLPAEERRPAGCTLTPAGILSAHQSEQAGVHLLHAFAFLWSSHNAPLDWLESEHSQPGVRTPAHQ